MNGQQLKGLGQERSLWAVTDQTRTDFFRVIASAAPGSVVSVNDYRDLLDQAEIPDRTRGGLWHAAVAAGYLTLARHDDGSPRLIQSTGTSAHCAHVRVYHRTGKEVTP